MPQFVCQCCGNLSLSKQGPGTGERCRICDWIDNLEQFENPTDPAGPNPVSLFTARNNYEKFGACTEAAVSKVQPARSNCVNPIWPTLLVAAVLGIMLLAALIAGAAVGDYVCFMVFAGQVAALYWIDRWLRPSGKWGQCRQCGYDLSGLRTRRCPECGQPF